MNTRQIQNCGLHYIPCGIALAGGTYDAEREARCRLYARQVIAAHAILREHRGGRRTNALRPVLAQTGRRAMRFDSVRAAAEFLRAQGLTRSDVAAAASSIRKRMRIGGACCGIAFVDAR